MFLRNPVGQDGNNLIRLVRVIGLQMDRKLVRAVHACVHHKNGRSNGGAFARFEYHRTDGQVGRSTALAHFDVGLFFEPERAIAGVGDLDLEGQVGVQRNLTVVDDLLIYGQAGVPPPLSSLPAKAIKSATATSNTPPPTSQTSGLKDFCFCLLLFFIDFVQFKEPPRIETYRDN